MKRVTLELNDTVYGLLQVLDPDGRVENVLEELIDHVQQGVYRPGSWERGWLHSVFVESDWTHKMEPGDPYGRNEPIDFQVFQRPRKA